ncbi:MAG: M24 family metallopeptidase [Candidatus Hodarchaeota archaeon]
MRQVPFPEMPYSEYELRIGKLKELLRKHKLDALCLFSPLNLRYYIGYRKASYGSSDWWRRGAIIDSDGKVILVLPQIHWVLLKKTSWVEDMRPWGGPDFYNLPKDFMTPFIDAIKELKLNDAKIGFELDSHTLVDLSFQEFEEIRRQLPKATIVDGSPVYWEQRQIKTDHEINIIRKLCDITVKGVQAAFDNLREGMTEKEVYQKMWETWVKEGLHDCPMAGRMMMRSGKERYDMLNQPPSDRKIMRGDSLYIDGGPCHLGYFTDIQRIIHIGEPSDLEKRLHAAANAAFDAMSSIIKDGTKLSDVFATGVENLKRHAPDAKHTITLIGHNVGLQTHEPPYIMADSEGTLKAGMYIAIEPYASDFPEYRVPGGFPEDNGIVTKDGWENLTKGLTRELWVVP